MLVVPSRVVGPIIETMAPGIGLPSGVVMKKVMAPRLACAGRGAAGFGAGAWVTGAWAAGGLACAGGGGGVWAPAPDATAGTRTRASSSLFMVIASPGRCGSIPRL